MSRGFAAERPVVPFQVALERFGFDTPRLAFTLRTAMAACLAVLLAWLLGLEHPQWSGMTVWASSLPLRGHLLEKSLFRGLGTIVGSVFGMGLLVAAEGQQWVIVAGLSAWIGLCAGAGNIIRGFASYGVMLAGYSAAMVTLLRSAESAGPFAVGIDRMLTALLGVLVALAVGWVFAARGEADNPVRSAHALSRRILAGIGACLAGRADRVEHRRLLSEMAAIEERLDAHAGGPLRLRGEIREIRRLLSAQMALLLWMRRPPPASADERLAEALQEAADACGEGGDSGHAVTALHRAADRAADPAFGQALEELALAMDGGHAGPGRAKTGGDAARVTLHRDWIGAREALLRAGFVILAVGAVWLATGWRDGAFMLLGAAIMMTIFSTADNPVPVMREVILGQALGVAGALACRWLVWPLMANEFAQVLSMMPFILLGGLLFGHRMAAGPLGFDYNMVVLLLLQPAWPMSGDVIDSLAVGVAVILGPAIGLIAFLLIFPVDGEWRRRTLAAMMVRGIEGMAGRPGTSRHRSGRRMQLHHRVLRSVRWADKSRVGKHEIVEASFALLLGGSAILHMNDVLQRPATASPAAARRLVVALARLRNLGGDPWRASRTLAAVAASRPLAADPAIDDRLLLEAAMELSRHAAFIRWACSVR